MKISKIIKSIILKENEQNRIQSIF